MIDLRSDTVTQPTPAMRQAMFDAEVGDDCYGDDPTVNRLETHAAQRLGKEAALFVPSGTFGNQLALFTHCRPGDEVIVGDDSHIVWHEAGAAGAIAGVQLRTLDSDRGVLDAEAIRRRIRVGDDIHAPRTGLICLENAHSNGRVIPLDAMAAMWDVAQRHAVPVHLDGARVFNAATTLGVDVREITRYADTVMCCLSKGLAAPVGSLLAGSAAFIDMARRRRKLLGGGLRQAGVLAAPGLIALERMTQRLHEDHAHARLLAEQLAALPGLDVDLDSVQINMVWFRFTRPIDNASLMARLNAAGILANPPEDDLMRLVTHWQVDADAVARTVAVFAAFLRQ
ncbi:low-specificity L-threonine aldolase [Chitiniphilus eburneus]|uniref:Low-specificity L-threonine aldolase n=1 Tax=Chitiniphilus eburneus TaxID=2571148 RepID=A0A4U0QCN3_9NEIS|nr:low-specificity L-threonine aldolase [Chitiniphilus eburneus]TJZ79177.1 low-specificity L-threonine aldolase [Chitiniphilus eburneus]